AGLTMSYFLSQCGREHVILERGQAGERWRSERWDSFCFQFPNSTIELPGYKYQSEDPDGFAPVPGNRSIYSRICQSHKNPIKIRCRCYHVGVLVKFHALFAPYERGRYSSQQCCTCHWTGPKGYHSAVQFRCAERHPSVAFERIPQCRRIAARRCSRRGER